MTISVKVGEAINLSLDVNGALSAITRIPNASPGDLIALVAAAASTLEAARTNAVTSALGFTVNGLKLGSELERLRAATTSNEQISALLGATSALGGMLATIPAPQIKGAGLAVALAAEAAKRAWDERQSFADVNQQMIDAMNRTRAIPITVIDPQTAIDRGLIDPKTFLIRPPARGVNDPYNRALQPQPRDPLATRVRHLQRVSP